MTAYENPEGGLTAAGRAKFKREDGSDLRPGVKGAADTPEKVPSGQGRHDDQAEVPEDAA